MYAVIETGGKQYKIAPNSIIDVELLEGAEKDKAVTFDKVLLVADGENLKIGNPLVAGALVSAKIIENGREPKVTTFKYKNKTGYKRTKGHKQGFTRVKIEEIKS
ncbi:MAG: 50S ribosomal protein L21 [Candidatus Margulisiibacteriota bacterium]